jgi:hypothetical protein
MGSYPELLERTREATASGAAQKSNIVLIASSSQEAQQLATSTEVSGGGVMIYKVAAGCYRGEKNPSSCSPPRSVRPALPPPSPPTRLRIIKKLIPPFPFDPRRSASRARCWRARSTVSTRRAACS